MNSKANPEDYIDMLTAKQADVQRDTRGDVADPEYRSCIDDLSGTICGGWFTGPSHPRDFRIVARIGEWDIGSARVGIYRDDLREAGYGSGMAGFHINFRYPVDPLLLALVTVEARRVADGTMVWTLRAPTPDDAHADALLAQINKIRSLFDRDYYAASHGPDIDDLHPLGHYYLFGRFHGYSPNILFDPAFYVDYAARHFGRTVAIGNALLDYIEVGEGIGIRPSALFDPAHVAANHPAIPLAGAMQAYLAHADKDEIETSLFLWHDWYGEEYDVAGNVLRHYVEEGAAKGYRPNPLFNTDLVCAILKCDKKDALTAYCLSDKVFFINTHELINSHYILDQAPVGDIFLSGKSVLEYYIENHRDICPNRLFDNQYFQENGSFHAAGRTLLSDYLEQGSSDLRPHPLFWDATYKAARPDVAQSAISPLQHYFLGGCHEYVQTHPLINHKLLIEETAGRTEGTPLEYYLRHYLEEKLAPDTGGPIDSHVNRPSSPVALRIGQEGDIGPVDGTVGLFAHVYYPDLLPEVAAVGRNLPAGSKIFVSTDTAFKADQIRAELPRLCDCALEVRVLPNRGRDIAPFLIGFADRLREVDYGMHIHTKKSPHYASAFSKWRRYLYGELAGSRAIVAGHLAALQHPEIGMSAPLDFAPLAPLLNWGGNRQRAERLIGAMGGQLPSGFSPELPSGSMFWFKTAALAPFLDLGLTLAHFDPEAGQVDGTLAHVIERSLFYICELSGHRYVRTTSQAYVEGVTLTSAPEVAMTRSMPSAWRKDGILEQYHPETGKFAARPVPGGPRLNLLIPTADTSVGYAGVSEAIRLFTGALAQLGPSWSGRIVMTDVAPSNMFTPPPGFRLVDSFDESETAQHAVVSGCDRNREFLTLREQDVFVASAWWNAGQAFDLIEQAKQLHLARHRRKLLYLVQDDERGFNPWSTKFKLCDDTYNHVGETFAVFNTPLLAQHFSSHSLSSESFTYEPPINAMLTPGEITPYDMRENLVLLYARPHAVRNGLDFLDAVVGTCLKEDKGFWKDWKWLAIGEDFDGRGLKSADHITVRGRLSLDEYREVLAKAKLGISLMVSPHPSYPPLEMAAHGVRVVANRFEDRDLNDLHSGITSFSDFDPRAVTRLLKQVATDSDMVQEPRIDWFFGEKTNAALVFAAMARAASEQF